MDNPAPNSDASINQIPRNFPADSNTKKQISEHSTTQ